MEKRKEAKMLCEHGGGRTLYIEATDCILTQSICCDYGNLKAYTM